MYEEDVRASMLYKMYKMDLFNFLGTYSEKHNALGVPEAMDKVWLAQLLSSLKVREKLGERGRNEKCSSCVCYDSSSSHYPSSFFNPNYSPTHPRLW